jgi:transcriptional regulator with XRE-family HTH domain
MDGATVRSVLARNIKNFRKIRNWSQENLAEKAGLSVVYLSDIERGNKWPYLDTMVKLASAFNIEVYELLKPENTLSPEIISTLVKYTEEVTAIFDKSLETASKRTYQSLIALKNLYVSSENL